MKKIIIALSPLILFLALAVSAQAATYYVDGNLTADCTSGNYSIANRACNGSNGNAFNTITDVNSRLQAGDTAFIRGGTYNQQIAPANSGSSGDPITYNRYENEVVNITYPSGYQCDLAIVACQNWTTILCGYDTIRV